MKKKSSLNVKKSLKQRSKNRLTGQEQCGHCLPAKCCMYFSLEIDRPRTRRDYGDFLWFLAHENVSIYVWNKSWYLMVHNQCSFLDKKTNLCTIYETRPAMCREHTTDDCEFDSAYDFEEHFKSCDELKRWMKKKRLMK